MHIDCPSHPSPLQLHPRPPAHCLARALVPHRTPANNTRTQREHRNYTRGQGVQGTQPKRTHAGCMGVRECAGLGAVHGRQAGQWLTCARPAAHPQIERPLEEVEHSSAYLQQGRVGRGIT